MRIRTALAAAYSWGRDVDLSVCDYGPTTQGSYAGPESYYHLLAGLARMTSARRIVEIGTHFGGGARALAEGQQAAGLTPNVLTFDVEDRAGTPILDHDGVHRVLADVRYPEGAQRLREWADGAPVDIVYIDALKDQTFLEETVAAFADLDVGWLIFDDVFANRSIRTAWNDLRAQHGERAITVDEVALDIRSGGFGQGVIALAPEALRRLDEDPTVVERLRGDARRRWRPALPTAVDPPPKPPEDGPRERPAELDLLRQAMQCCAGSGEIVVVGAASGTTTRTLAGALASRPNPHSVSINVVANFLTTSAAVSRARQDYTTPRRVSFLADFRARIGELAPAVNLISGDVPSLRWSGKPIELLVIGWHRDETELAHAFTELLPHCTPGGSLLIIEDLAYEAAAYLHAAVGQLIDHFDVIGLVPNAVALAPISTPEPDQLRQVARLHPAHHPELADRLEAALDSSLGSTLIERGRRQLLKRLETLAHTSSTNA